MANFTYHPLSNPMYRKPRPPVVRLDDHLKSSIYALVSTCRRELRFSNFPSEVINRCEYSILTATDPIAEAAKFVEFIS